VFCVFANEIHHGLGHDNPAEYELDRGRVVLCLKRMPRWMSRALMLRAYKRARQINRRGYLT